MEADKKFSKISQLETVAPWPNSPFSMMAPSTLPLAPSSSQVWKRPYLMNHFENGEGNRGAKTHFQPLDIRTSTTTLIPTPTTSTNPTPTATITTTTTTTPTPSTTTPITTTTPAVEAIKDKGKKPQKESGSDADHGNDNKIVTVKTEKEETDDTLIGAPLQIRVGRNVAPESLDPRKLKRILSNRVSAQKSRLKKLQYVAEMEKKAKALEAQVALLSPQVEFFKNQNYFLQMEQHALNESISVRAVDKLHKDALIEANKEEVQRLRLLQLKIFEQQQMQASMFINMDGVGSMDPKMVNYPGFTQSELGKMLCSSDSKKAQSGEKTAAENLQNQIREAAEQTPDVKPSLGVFAGSKK
ncbi:basic leucine zipper 34-like [Rosa chinensis]|uniref:basic leucine zipper 34-like n=1 Tax=Rosa chinensis TaxID=74649 RepID=UPI001AD8EAB3|nr:basic leucine zipper 34-like [Rosa chinensis]